MPEPSREHPGPPLFAAARTALTPASANYTTLNNRQNTSIQSRVASGRTFQQASRIEAQITAASLNLACCPGTRGVLTRVSPA